MVRVNSTRQPFSTRAKPRAAARCDLPPPAWTEHQRLAPFSSQLSPADSALTWALLIIGTTSKSKLSRDFAGRKPRLVEMALDAPAGALGHLVLGERRQEARGRPALLVGLGGKVRPDRLDGRQPQVVESQGQAAGIDGL